MAAITDFLGVNTVMPFDRARRTKRLLLRQLAPGIGEHFKAVDEDRLAATGGKVVQQLA